MRHYDTRLSTPFRPLLLVGLPIEGAATFVLCLLFDRVHTYATHGSTLQAVESCVALMGARGLRVIVVVVDLLPTSLCARTGEKCQMVAHTLNKGQLATVSA